MLPGRASKIPSRIAFLALLILSTSALMYGQVAGATLTGTITDSTGALIPNATVSIRNTATGVVKEVPTDNAGLYSVPNLVPGPYEVTVSAPGFAALKQSGITLTVGQTQQLNLTLQVGTTTQQVQVTAAPPLVQTATSTVSANVSGTTVRELPLNGRDWTQLATLQPGITAIPTQAQNGVNAARGNRGFGNQLAANGHRPNENNYRMDGVSINDYSNGAPGSSLGVNLGVDAIQEFSVEQTNYSAAYGRTSGGIINAVTKSGTNQIHGDAYEFLRNDALDAANFFDNFNGVQKPAFRRNQFGASIGGPIQKDKTFFFGDYEGIRQSLGFTFTNHVPTAAARAGNLCSNPAGAPANAPCTPSTVAVSPLVAPYLAFWPMPNGPILGNGDTGIYSVATQQGLDENFFTTRLDHTFSEKDSIHGSYFFDNAPLTLPDSLNTWVAEVFTRRQMAELEESHTFSSSLVNTARLGFNRTTGLVNQPLSAINPLATDKSLGGLPGLTAPGVSSVGGAITPFVGGFGGLSQFFHHQNSFQGYDDLFVTHGNHSVQTGFAVERLQYNLLAAGRGTGSFAFGSLADFLTDQPQQVQTLNPSTKSMAGLRSTILAAYAQDDWRARSNLTLNLGLRWEGVTAPTCSVGQCPLLTNLYAPGPAVESPVLFNPPNDAGFEPRVGFSWDPFHTGKTAIRGGFGVFDILDLPYEYTAKIALAAPFEEIGGASNLPQGAFPSVAFQLAAFNPTKFLAPYIQQNPPLSYAMNWNFNLQHQFGKGLMATVGYIGSRTVHGPFTMDDNNIVMPAALTSAGYLWPSTPGTRINPQVGDIRSLMWNDPATYHALQAEVRKTFSHGLQFQGSYTWGKCIDRGSAVIFGDAFTNSISSLLYFDNSLRQGLCDFNISQSFVGNYLWDLPTPFTKGSIPDHVLAGWELGGIITLESGVPFTPVIGGDPLGVGGTDPWAYPDRLSGPGCGSAVNPGNVNGYIKLNCFALPQATPAIAAQCVPFGAPTAPIGGTCSNLLGNAGRNELVGPGLATFDFSLFKNVPVKRVSENFNVQFRAEFFNLLNRPNFLPPLDNIDLFSQSGGAVGGAGQIDATSTTSREIQFGLKLNW